MTTPVALTYNGFVTNLGLLAVYDTETVGGVVQGYDTNFNGIIPQAINYAELRIQRDVNLLPAKTSNSYTTTANNGVLTVPVGDFVTIETLVVNGIPLTRTSMEFIQNVYGTGSTAAQPQWFADYGGDSATGGNTSGLFLLGPIPDQAYASTAVGMVRLPSLNANNTNPAAGTATTFISTFLPDLMLQAAMIYVSEFQRNWGSINNDPGMAMTYESSYGNLLKGAIVEEARKRFQASAWSANPPPPVATPNRQTGT